MTTPYQRIFLDTYCGGEYAHATSVDDLDGDGLAIFLFNELDGDCENLSMAHLRVGTAVGQLQDLEEKLYAAIVAEEIK
jgi:hypothetical protein